MEMNDKERLIETMRAVEGEESGNGEDCLLVVEQYAIAKLQKVAT